MGATTYFDIGSSSYFWLDRVCTGSDSDLVSDGLQYVRRILDSDGWTRSLSLPVLTRSK